MNRLSLAAIICACFLTACATQKPHQCPLGGVTHITASGSDAHQLAYNMAAQDTLKDGFDKFTVLSKQEKPDQVKMTVHMLHAHENDYALNAIDAHSLLPSVFTKS